VGGELSGDGARGGGNAEAGAPPGDDAATVAYFRAIEEAFVRLRGAPLLLSPADFQVAARWRRVGVPIGLVIATLEELFEKRRARGAKGRINSLRYCAPAVEGAWSEVQELQGPAGREPEAETPVRARLDALAAALPEALPDRAGWVGRLDALDGPSEEVEEALRALDRELLAALTESLLPAERERLTSEVEAILDGLRDRFPDGELAALRERLFAQRLRRLRAAPLLSLF
jgi:hypothetical protein